MATRPKRTKKLPPRARKIDPSSHPALERLLERLSGSRLKAQSTISSYLITGSNFLLGLKSAGETPDQSDYDQYFIRRRKAKVSERTLRKEFFHLKKLALANDWSWPFESRRDAPYPEDPAQSYPFLPEQVVLLIQHARALSAAERFYLAVATTWIVRREELAGITKRDFDGEFFTIHHAKHGRIVKHLIPPALKQVFADYRPKQHNPSALSLMFRRISAKAGITHQGGYGWHSIRHTLNTMLTARLPQNNFDPALIADYAGWRPERMGVFFGGVAMVGVYRHPEILDTDPYGCDRIIYSIHPFLPFWEERLKK